MSSALISYKGCWDEGSRNWFWKRVALEGFLSESDRFRPCIGSSNCWAFWTKFDRLNMLTGYRGGRQGALDDGVSDVCLSREARQRGWVQRMIRNGSEHGPDVCGDGSSSTRAG